MNTITLHIGDVRDIQAGLADSSVDLVVTSPPFLALRSYLPADHPDKGREIGSEATPAEYLDTLLELTDEWRRLLTATGSLCVEIGDTYSGSTADGGDNRGNERYPAGRSFVNGARNTTRGWPLAKSLCGIPTLYTWSLAYGHNLLNPDHRIRPWRVRNLLTWTRPNPPVGQLGDKVRPATSFVTVACDSDKRWFDLDAVRTGHYAHPERIGKPINNGRGDTYGDDVRSTWSNQPDFLVEDRGGPPPLDWQDDNQPDWQPLHNLPTHPYRGAHYATFNPALPRRLIEAMCPREVCRVCGEARRRVVNAERTVDGQPIESGALHYENRVNGLPAIGIDRSRVDTARTTLGWTDCGCRICGWCGMAQGHTEICDGFSANDPGRRGPPPPQTRQKHRPGLTLDPFGGSGTTAIAAAHVGRDTILIDFDARNVDLIRQRIAENFRIVSEVGDGDTYRWTVTAASKHELTNIAAGQGSLFDQLDLTA